MDYVLQMYEIDQEQIYIFGASLGGALATYSALNYQESVKGLILQNTLASVESLVVSKAAIMKPLLPWMLRVRFPTNERINHIKLPMMFIVGLEDEATGPEQMYEIYDIAEESAVFRVLYEIPGCEHYLPWYYGGQEYDQKLTDFIDNSWNISKAKLLPPKQESSIEKSLNKSQKSIQEWFEHIF